MNTIDEAIESQGGIFKMVLLQLDSQRKGHTFGTIRYSFDTRAFKWNIAVT